jgi:hypothetical protein
MIELLSDINYFCCNCITSWVSYYNDHQSNPISMYMLSDKLNIYEVRKLILGKTWQSFPSKWVVTSCNNHVTPGKSISSTRWTGGRLDPMPAVDILQKEKASFTCQELNSDSWVIQSIASHYIDWYILAPNGKCRRN